MSDAGVRLIVRLEDIKLVEAALARSAADFETMAEGLTEAAIDQDDLRAHCEKMRFEAYARKLRNYAARLIKPSA